MLRPAIFLVVECVFASLTSLPSSVALAVPPSLPPRPKITLPQLYAELRREPADFCGHHLGLMMTLRSNGYRLYDLDEDVSADCAATLQAAINANELLYIFEKVHAIVHSTLQQTVRRLKELSDRVHPLEHVCQGLEKSFAAEPSAALAFPRAKVDAQIAKNKTSAASAASAASNASAASAKTVYANSLLDSIRSLTALVTKQVATVPQISRSIVNAVFRNQLDRKTAFTDRHHLLAKSVVTVARTDHVYGQQLQRLYYEALGQDAPKQTSGADPSLLSLQNYDTLWFFPKMMRNLYAAIAADEKLKKEVNRVAAVIGQGFDKKDLDFGQL